MQNDNPYFSPSDQDVFGRTPNQRAASRQQRSRQAQPAGQRSRSARQRPHQRATSGPSQGHARAAQATGNGFVASRGVQRTHAGTGYRPASAPRRRQPSMVPQGRSSNDRSKGMLVLVAVIAVAAVVGIFAWTNRSVEITLNGARTSLKVGTGLEQVIGEKKVSCKAGNFVSVSGSVIDQGGGTAYTATVDGRELSSDDAGRFRVGGGESIDISDGADVTEDYSSTTTETQPKLEMDGSYGAIAYVSQWGEAGQDEVRTGNVSGQTATVNVRPVKNCIIKLHNVTPTNGQKVVALTFDDGPSAYTEKYLSILKEHGAVATFFNLGQSVDEYPDQAKAIVDAGCQLCSHTYSHDDLPKDSADKVYSEVTGAFSSITKATGITTTAIRPPYGDFKQSTWLSTKGAMTVSVLWNMDSEDWRMPGADKIVSNATSGIQNGYIILMHDGGGKRDQDVEALPTLIDTLKGQGYTFVTISDLMKSDDTIPEEVASCDQTMPDGAVWPTELAT
ncbi:MAG: polysaccharide deacetylase family protein [Atopobiaceae bacterium]|jgi:peptidoglycan/xylan/chitin deacetylase (PgdA/CDA1 family)|nr:polysaccharide deacetylase family protein [Atopobiaceae bacterium]